MWVAWQDQKAWFGVHSEEKSAIDYGSIMLYGEDEKQFETTIKIPRP